MSMSLSTRLARTRPVERSLRIGDEGGRQQGLRRCGSAPGATAFSTSASTVPGRIESVVGAALQDRLERGASARAAAGARSGPQQARWRRRKRSQQGGSRTPEKAARKWSRITQRGIAANSPISSIKRRSHGRCRKPAKSARRALLQLATVPPPARAPARDAVQSRPRLEFRLAQRLAERPRTKWRPSSSMKFRQHDQFSASLMSNTGPIDSQP